MPDDFLTIKEAAVEVGRSEVTIRRFVQGIVKGSDETKRAFIKPTPDELQRHQDGPPPAWRIERQHLQKHFAPHKKEGGEQTAGVTNPQEDQIVSILKSQIASMERQLIVKDEQIKSMTVLTGSLGNQLNERLHENNILMKGFQEWPVLPARTPSHVVESQAEKQSKDAAVIKPAGKKVKKAESRKPKGNWLSRLLGDAE